MVQTSYGEQLCRELLKKWFPNDGVLYNYRPMWLKNPATGRNLELDIFYPDLKIAFEFNGIQHKLLQQSRKDYFKNKKCYELGIMLLSVYHPMDLFKCKSLIKKHTGVKIPSGKNYADLLLKLSAYITGQRSSYWYDKCKIESDSLIQDRDNARKKRRQEKLSERRKLKRLSSSRCLLSD